MTTVRLERTFDASAEAVFDAWTRPEVLRRWWAAGKGWTTPEAEVETVAVATGAARGIGRGPAVPA
jgi:uncharacterized protein YndB with AHSA1/START domain